MSPEPAREVHKETKKDGSRRPAWLKLLILPAGLFCMLLWFQQFLADYYPADEAALQALVSDTVTVEETDYGYYFDGPSEDRAMIFYPGAKVDETAYAPLLHALAAQGIDVCLLHMPHRFALFNQKPASAIAKRYDYAHWYIAGHSLGGVMAAGYAADHAGEFEALVLLGAYAVKELPDSLTEIVILGSEDHVINRERLQKGWEYAPVSYYEYDIQGGNHAQFGNYGIQKGDGTAAITAAQQQEETIRVILEKVPEE